MSSVKRRIEEGFVEIAPSFVKGYCKGKKGFLKQIEDVALQSFKPYLQKIDDLELFLLDNGLTDEFVKWRRERDEKRKM